jgi:hypothetical protein
MTIAVFLFTQRLWGYVILRVTPMCPELHFSAHRHDDNMIVGLACGLCFAQSSVFLWQSNVGIGEHNKPC